MGKLWLNWPLNIPDFYKHKHRNGSRRRNIGKRHHDHQQVSDQSQEQSKETFMAKVAKI